jgi:hypothetical protein
MEQFSYHWIQNRVAVRLIGKIHELVHDPYKDGTKVMDEDWDNLIVLDAAQYDLFEETIDTDIFDNYSTVTSIGSTSGQWLSRNFSDRTFGDTINVTANPHTSVEVPEQFFELIEVDQEPIADSEKDGEILAFHPETLCEAARTAHEEFPNKRMIVHFMQPHGTGGLVETQESKQKTHEKTIQAMVEYILDIHEHANGKTVVTADHGELYNGGIKAWLGLEGHKPRLRIPQLVCVPWAELYGDRRLIESGSISEVDASRGEIRKGLRELGYLD